MKQLQIHSLKNVAKEHKKNCRNADCNVSLSALGMIYRRLIEREMTDEERLIFC